MPLAVKEIITLYLFVVGTVFGSFATLIGDRVPKGESIVRPGSHCAHCQRSLRAYELIPILSWIFLRGRCRTCQTPIPLRYPLQEIFLGVAFALSDWRGTSVFEIFVSCLFWFAMTIAVSSDFSALVVPNWLTLSGAVLIYGLTVWQTHNYLFSAMGMVLGFGTIFMIHILSAGNMGLGDAKLYLMVGAFLGPYLTVESFFFAACFGAVIGIFLRLGGRVRKAQHIPFVPFICLGVGVTQFFLFALPGWYAHVILGLR